MAAILLFLLAALWPWDVYTYVPGLNAELTTAITTLLVMLLAIDIARLRKVSAPFEIMWPAIALAGLIAAGLLRHDPAFSPSQLGLVATYMAALHFAPSRACIRQWLWLSCVSIAAGALWTHIAFRVPPAFPTAFSIDTHGVLWLGRRLAAGALVLVIGGAVAGQAFAAAVKRARIKHDLSAPAVMAAIIFVLATSALVYAIAPAHTVASWRPPRWNALSGLALASCLAALWSLARTVAKNRVFAATASSSHDDAAWARLMARTLVLAVVFCLCFSVKPSLGFAVLAGLAAAYPLPGRAAQFTAPRMAYALLAPCALLIAVNAAHVFPENQGDPRNFEVAADRDSATGRLDRLDRRLDFVAMRSPNEPRVHLWRARHALAQEFPNRAAHEFRLAVQAPRGHRTILRPVDNVQRNDLLVRLRDACAASRQPHTLIAYERALVAAGNADNALDSLRQRVTRLESRDVTAAAAPYAAALAFLLGDAALATSLDDWPAAHLRALLEDCGAVIRGAPPGLAPSLRPLILSAWALPDGVELCVCAGASPPTRANAPASARLKPIAECRECAWTDAVEQGGAWRVELVVDGHVAARVELNSEHVAVDTMPVPANARAPEAPLITLYEP